MKRISPTILLDHLPPLVGSLAISAVGLRLRRKRLNVEVLDTLEAFQALETQLWKTLEQTQLDRLKEMLEFSYNNTDFYKTSFDKAKFHADRVESLSDLQQAPLLERSDIAHHSKELTSSHNEELVHASSSGTTGARLHFVVPKYLKLTMNYAALYQYYAWFGITPTDKRVTLGARFLGNRKSGAVYHNWSENQLLLGVNTLNSSTVTHYVKSIKRFAPTFIQGHPSALRHLVELSAAKGLEIPTVKAIATTGESLTEDTRAILEAAFNCPAFATYGMGESCMFAGECTQRNGYHIHPAFGIVETVNTSQGTVEAVLTGLVNKKMPLIRYRPGDLLSRISFEPCACGCTWPRIMSVEGRSSDVITTEGGEPILPVQLRSKLGHLFNLPPYTIVQEKKANNYRLEVYLDDSQFKNPPTYADELAYLQSLFGASSNIKISYNTKNDLFKNGAKHKMVIRE